MLIYRYRVFRNIDPHIAIYTLVLHYIDPKNVSESCRNSTFPVAILGSDDRNSTSHRQPAISALKAKDLCLDPEGMYIKNTGFQP